MQAELLGSGSLLGYCAMHQRLHSRCNIVILQWEEVLIAGAYNVIREVVRFMLSVADPVSVHMRTQRTLED